MARSERKLMITLLKPASALVVLATCLAALAGCSIEGSAPTNTATLVERDAGVLGVRLCVTNKTEEIAKIEWLTFDQSDPLDKNILRVGQTTCAAGWQASLLENDVTLKVTWPDRLAQVFTAWNLFAGEPQVRADAAKQSAANACGIDNGEDVGFSVVCSDGYSVNESRRYPAYNFHDTTLERIADSAEDKEFAMTLVK
jgi:hypothetical protein